MEYICLSLNEFIEFIDTEFTQAKPPISNIRTMVERAKVWDLDIGLLNYFYARVLLNPARFKEINQAIPNPVDGYTDLKNLMAVSQHECAHDFIDYMFKYSVNLLSLDLADMLVQTQQAIGEHVSVRTLHP